MAAWGKNKKHIAITQCSACSADLNGSLHTSLEDGRTVPVCNDCHEYLADMEHDDATIKMERRYDNDGEPD